MTTIYERAQLRTYAYAEAKGAMTAVAVIAVTSLGTDDRGTLMAEIVAIDKKLRERIDVIQAGPIT